MRKLSAVSFTTYSSCALSSGADFVIRLPTKSFKQSRGLFTDEKAGRSFVCELSVGENTIGLPKGEAIKVRLLSLDIPETGEREVIATSLLDEVVFPTSLFGWLYYKHWGIQTYYHLIKEYALDLFFSHHPEEVLVRKLSQLFQMNPHYKRIRPPTQQNNTSPMASARYRKKIRKITF